MIPTESPKELSEPFTSVIACNYLGQLPCLSGIQKGCSDVLDAEGPFEIGRSGNYAVVCAGTTVRIFYNRFTPVA